jgi:hypothetical protein
MTRRIKIGWLNHCEVTVVRAERVEHATFSTLSMSSDALLPFG